MKKYIFSILIGVAASLGLVSCSGDYLDLKPDAYVATETILSSTENAELVINGICKLMTTQYLSTQGMNGEGTIKTWYGNYPGNDFQKCNLTGWASITNATYHENTSSKYLYYPWFYYYKLISNANAVICNIDDAEGAQEDKDFLKAQALVFRAYSFFMLSQLYCHRWSDESGNCDGIVLRIDESTGSQALATLAETYTQIYGDLDEAISLFQSSGRDRGSDEFFKPNLSVAYAVYARAALTREDWSNAAQYAALARSGYNLMSSSDYIDGGFHTPNSEWIWGVYEAEDQTLYYYGFFAYQGSDSSASACRSYPCAISQELIEQIPESDSRRVLYLVPVEYDGTDDDGNTVTMNERDDINSAGRVSSGHLYDRAQSEYGNKLYETSYVFMYMQFKFTVDFQPGGGSFPLFRTAEMYYIEAEADCHLGKDSDAQQLLYDANKAYDANLTKSTNTGDALLEEIKLYRRFDLWGEGYDWFDCKRWGASISRKSIADGGSFHATFAITYDKTDRNKWTWMLPIYETDYNDEL